MTRLRGPRSLQVVFSFIRLRWLLPIAIFGALSTLRQTLLARNEGRAGTR